MSGIDPLAYGWRAGPSLHCAHPAGWVELPASTDTQVQAEPLAAVVATHLPGQVIDHWAPPLGEIGLADLALATARALQALAALDDPPAELHSRQGDGGVLLVPGRVAPIAMVLARTSVAVAVHLEQAAIGISDNREELRALLARMDQDLVGWLPDPISAALLRAARARDIPVSCLGRGARKWQFGQGRHRLLTFEAGSADDSFTGMQFAENKAHCASLLRLAGLPAAEHLVVRDLDGAREAARHLGWPVVVKPVDGAKGQGVTAGIANADALARAWRTATADGQPLVLVERHVAGTDYRVVAVAGQFAWAVARIPPSVTGDGQRTIAELIDAENVSRDPDAVAARLTYLVSMDAEVEQTLADLGLAVDSVPEAGRHVVLRSIANTATGGSIEDCSADVHPDNKALVETVARLLDLDTIGMDLMAPDIRRSWRDQRCAIIEVNGTPGFSSDRRAHEILARHFPEGDNGRVPVVLLVTGAAGAPPELAAAIAEALADALGGGDIGMASASHAALGGDQRFVQPAGVAAHAGALLLDPQCHGLVVEGSADALGRDGLPVDRCDLAVTLAGVPVPRQLLHWLVGETQALVDGVDLENCAGLLQPALQRVVGRL